VASLVTTQTFPAGEPVVRQGDVGDALYLLRSGEVAVELERPGSATHNLATLAPGACFGEQALLTGEPRSATVRALTPVEVLRLDRADFMQIVQEHPDRGRYFVQLGLQRQRPRRHDHWVIERQTGQDGTPVFVLKDTQRLQYLRLTEEGAFLWDLMDGLHSIKDLAHAYFDRFGTIGLQTILDLTQQLHEAGFVTIQRFEGRVEARRAMSWLEAAWLVRYFALPDLDGAITQLYRLVRPLYSRAGQFLLLALALAGAVRFLLYLVQGGVAEPNHSLALWLVVATFIGIGLQVVLHEAAHALTCKHFGREVHSAGIGWYFFLPVAYVDTSDSWLAGRWARIAVAAAGPYANFIISGLATLGIGFAGDAGVRAALFQIALTGDVLGLLNLNPLLEFDGYYVLMDWLDIPNLRSKALAFIGSVLWRTPRPPTTPRLHRIYAGYGTLALLYTGFTAWTVATGYHRFLQAGVSRILPSLAAEWLGWACAAVLTWLILQRAWNDLRRGARAA
jgi:putative peptide zinc metalloprotease protein